MVKRTIVWTQTAALQRRSVLKYWTIRNGSTAYAEKLISIIKDHLKVILEHPEAFKKANFPDTRESAMGHFSIFYKITSHEIIITAFWDNRQDPKELYNLLKRK